VLAGLGGSDDRMSGDVCVFTGMAIRRAITTECHAALLTRAQMYPLRADLHAFSAFAAIGVFDRRYRVEMRAASARHRCLFSQYLMNGRNGNRSFTHRRSDSFDIARANIADGKNSRQTRFEEIRRPGERPTRIR
jgi:hypothetical protein